ncbi:TPA: hypothetical protein NV949_004709, partial [Escherichia coli]|nr:hypothetical protein [Escherichia coli]
GLGIMVIPLRNPTLVQLSIQTLFIDEVVTDVNQCSLRISDRVIKMANGSKRAPSDGKPLMRILLKCWETLKRIYQKWGRKSETTDTMTYAKQYC